MQRSTLNKVSLFLRRSHMYVALFLTPWMAMYALSTLVFNHFNHFSRMYGGTMEHWRTEREMPYTRTFAAGASRRAVGEQILSDLHLAGSFETRKIEEDEGEHLVIDRADPLAPRRITYYPDQKKLVIQRSVFRTPNFLTRLHASVGYNRFKARQAWALGVDLSIFGTLLWVLSGFWLWWELKVTRRWGMVFGIAGVALFSVFLVFA